MKQKFFIKKITDRNGNRLWAILCEKENKTYFFNLRSDYMSAKIFLEAVRLRWDYSDMTTSRLKLMEDLYNSEGYKNGWC